MRIITGTAKELKIKTPKSFEIRPAADRVKESVFNIFFLKSKTYLIFLQAPAHSELNHFHAAQKMQLSLTLPPPI